MRQGKKAYQDFVCFCHYHSDCECVLDGARGVNYEAKMCFYYFFVLFSSNYNTKASLQCCLHGVCQIGQFTMSFLSTWCTTFASATSNF